MHYMDLAIQQARINPLKKWKLGAVGTRSGRVLSVAMNTTRQNPSPPGTIHYLNLGHHAETNCLRQSPLVPKTMYVARVSKNGELRLSLPCPRCFSALQRAGVKTVYYTTDMGIRSLKL